MVHDLNVAKNPGNVVGRPKKSKVWDKDVGVCWLRFGGKSWGTRGKEIIGAFGSVSGAGVAVDDEATRIWKW